MFLMGKAGEKVSFYSRMPGSEVTVLCLLNKFRKTGTMICMACLIHHFVRYKLVDRTGFLFLGRPSGLPFRVPEPQSFSLPYNHPQNHSGKR